MIFKEGLCVLWKIMNDVEGVFLKELTFCGVALFSRECIEPRVDNPFYTMAI
jgi:hypothetical protein